MTDSSGEPRLISAGAAGEAAAACTTPDDSLAGGIHAGASADHSQRVDDVPPPQVCRHWHRRGHCIFEDKCKFAHPADLRGTAWPVNTYPPPENGNGTQRKSNRGPGKRNLVRNRFRASAFRRFLLETFGAEALMKGSGVLDVAGGKGELSFELVNLNNIPSTVVDPRPLHLTKFEKYLKHGIYHRNAVFAKHVFRSLDRIREEPTIVPRHLQMCLEPVLVDIVGQVSRGGQAGRKWAEAEQSAAATAGAVTTWDEGSEGSLPLSACDSRRALQAAATSAMDAARAMAWTRKGLVCSGHEDSLCDIYGADDDDGCASDSEASTASEASEEAGRWEERLVSDPTEAVELLLNCSAVVGMHADQATEPIVDLALHLGKPFAVVPCCVYGKYFPGRKMASGEPVGNYDQLVEYLLAKSPSCCSAVLPFEGRNVAVFGRGGDSAACSSGTTAA